MAVILLVAILIYWIYPKHSSTIKYRDPAIYGVVATKETAIRIAEAVWLEVYGDYIYNSTPFVATLRDTIWVVEGTLHAERGGTPYIEISKKNGAILKVVHYK